MSYGTNSYEYNADGQRTSKTVGGVKTEFFYNGSILAGQKCGNDTLTFMYDNNGDAFGFTYNGTEYYYIKNAQNDVTAITDNMGIVVAKYTYDAWGKTISITDANGNVALQNSIGNINPIRYRSYYFDAETNLYHLNTRYYSPIICRFLNADSVAGANQDILAYNLFAYCSNDPVNNCDTTGQGKISNWFKNVASRISNWWNSTPPASSFTVPSTNQITSTVSELTLGSIQNSIKNVKKSAPFVRQSDGIVKIKPTHKAPKYAKEAKIASKASSAISALTLSLDISNTWTANNGNTNGQRVLKSVIQVTGAAAGVLVCIGAATMATPTIVGVIASAAVVAGGSYIVNLSSEYYYKKTGIV